MSDNILYDMPVESEEALAEWLCIAFMHLKGDTGLLIGGRIPPAHALQIARMLLSKGLVKLEGQNAS